MTAALRYEWRRISTIRSTWILLAVAIALAVLFAVLISWAQSSAMSSQDQAAVEATGATFVINFAISNLLVWVPLGTIAAQTFGQEYRNGTIRLTLTAFPRRDEVFWAKAIIACAVISVGMIVAFVLCLIVVFLFGVGDATGVSLFGFLVRSLLNLIGFCLIVFGITLITRVLALGVVIPLVFALVFESIIIPGIVVAMNGIPTEPGQQLAEPWFLRILPFRAGNNFAAGTDMVANGLVYLVWVVVIAGVGYILFKRRDA